MSETNDAVSNLFTKGSHHRNVSVLYLTQNLFHKNKDMRTILTRTTWDAGQFAILARQMYPSESKFATEAYRDATERPFGYLFVDLKPQQHEYYRQTANMCTDEDH